MTREKIRMKPSIRGRVDIRIPLFTTIVVAPLIFSIFWFQHRVTYNDTLISSRDQAGVIYGYVEKRLDKSTPDQVRTREDIEGGTYKQIHEAFQRVGETSGIQYLYTTRMNEGGEFVYLIDCLDQSESDSHYPGDLIGYEIYPDIQWTLNGQKVLPDRIRGTEWGKIFITHMPIYDGEQVLGVVGVEFEVGHQYDTYQSLHFLPPLSILLFSLGACLTSRLLFGRIPNPFYRDISNTDYLIRLKDRNAYQLDIENRIARRVQEGTGFILLDLNGLERVDDTLRYDVGDAYITYVSKAYLNMRTREAVMYHTGGDELMVVIPDADRDKIQDFIRWFGGMFNGEAFMPESTFSWGYSIYDLKTDADLYSTCHRVDKDMYTRKQQYYKNKNTQEDTDGTTGQVV